MATAAWLLLATCLIHAMTLAHGYRYIGCFVDSSDRDLPVLAGSSSMSISKCNQLCTSRRFVYFGVQAANECWCGNSYGMHGSRSSGECHRRCSGQGSEFCGAGWRNSVYSSDFEPGMKFLGCFVDASNRDLPVLAARGAMSITGCQAACKQRHFAYFGVQNSNECWCGNSYGKYGAKPANECKMRCSSDSTSKCGSGWRNSVYATGLTPLHVPSVSNPMNPNLRDQLAAQIKSQYVQFPDGVLCDNCLINSWSRRDVDLKSKVFPVRDLNSVLASYPAKVRDKVRVLQFGANAKTTFEDFHINISGNSGWRKSFIGMARRVNDNVELGMVAVHIVGNLVPKFNVYQKKVCKKILWVFTKCTTHNISERRGYQPSEISLIDRALLSETFRLFGEKLATMTV